MTGTGRQIGQPAGADAARSPTPPACEPGGGPALSIDRLTLTVPQMSQADAARLAELVAEALADWPTAPTASGRITQVSTTVTAAAQDATPSRLAAKIAEAILAQTLRELT